MSLSFHDRAGGQDDLAAHQGLRLGLAADFAAAGVKVAPGEIDRAARNIIAGEPSVHAAFARASRQGVRSYLSIYAAIRGRLPDERVLAHAAMMRGDTSMVVPYVLNRPVRHMHDGILTALRHVASQGKLEVVQHIFRTIRKRDTDPSTTLKMVDAIWSGALGTHHGFHQNGAQFHVTDWLEDEAPGLVELSGASMPNYHVGSHTDFSRRCRQLPHLDPQLLVGLEGTGHVPVRARAYRAIRQILAYEFHNDMAQLNRKAYFCALVFGTPERLLTYFQRWGRDVQSPMSDLLTELDPPLFAHIRYDDWGDALIRQGPEMAFLMKYITRVPVALPLRNDKGDISLRLTRELVSNYSYLRRDENPELAEICFDTHADEKAFNTALGFLRDLKDTPRPQPQKHETIPDIFMRGSLFGMGESVVFRRLDWDDRRMLFVGGYARCCEKIGGQYEGTVHHAIKTRRSGFYVIERDKKIIGHTWVWRGKDNAMIIDGFESVVNGVKDENLTALLKNLRCELLDPFYKPYAITRLILGRSGKNFTPEAAFPELRTEEESPQLWAEDHLSDSDIINKHGHLGNATTQYLVGDIRYYPSWYYIDRPEPRRS